MTSLIAPISAEYIVGPLPWPEGGEPPVSGTLPDLLDSLAAGTPDAPALVAGEVHLSYSELSARAQAFAAALVDLGMTTQSRLGLLLPNIAEWAVAAFGGLRLGIPIDCFNTWVMAYDLEYLLEQSETQVLVMVPTVRNTDLLGELRKLVPEFWTTQPGELRSERFPKLKSLVVVGEVTGATPLPSGALQFDDLVAAASALPVPANAAQPGETAYIMYTSGTTQHPKAVPLQHRLLIENGFAIGSRQGLTSSDRVWLGSPLFWSFGGANAAMAAMTNGACLVLQERFTPQTTVTTVIEERCTAMYLLPAMVSALVEEVAEQMRSISSLRTGVVIGRPEEIERAAVDLGISEICNVYGSTETYGNCTVTPHDMPLADRLVSQGPPLVGVSLRVVDLETGAVLPPGTPGELQVKGRITTGYLGNEEATASAFTEDGWFRTGDTIIIRPSGDVQFVGRHTDMIKSSGINISPSEVEGFLVTHPAVEAVVVVGAPHPTRGEVPVAFAVLRQGAVATGDEIREFCKGAIASYKIPFVVEIIDRLPTTNTGKITRKELKQPAIDAVEARLLAG
jgi:fatty-acyl-CoA synthase